MPKFTSDGVIVNCPAVVPVPVPFRGTFRAGPVTKTLPLLVIADSGAKVRLSVILCPALRVIGSVAPLTENPAPDNCSAVRVNFHVRVLVSTSGSVELLPTATWPNERLEGLAVIPALVNPVPASCNRSCGFEALLVKVMLLPGTYPVVVGENVRLTEVLCPAPRVKGKLRLDTVNSLPVILLADSVTLVVPLFVNTAICVSV